MNVKSASATLGSVHRALRRLRGTMALKERPMHVSSIATAVVIALALGASAASAQHVPSYTLELVHGFPGQPAAGIYAFNGKGLATGAADTHTALWDFVNGTFSEFDTSGGPSAGYAINGPGQVVGVETKSGNEAMLWQLDGTPVDLGVKGEAFGINDASQVVGVTLDEHAFVWEAGSVSYLPTLGGRTSAASGINNAGQIAGRAQNADGQMRMVRWNGTAVEDHSPNIVGNRPYSYEGVYINASGQMAGNLSGPSNVPNRAIMSSEGPAEVLPIPPGTSSIVNGINDAGVVVGSIGKSPAWAGRGVIWFKGHMLVLDTLVAPGQLPSGWHIASTTAISNDGWISCSVFTNPGNQPCLLKPLQTSGQD